MPTWPEAWAGAFVLLAAGGGLRRHRPGWPARAAFATEAGILLALYGLWQLAGSLAESRPPIGAISRGEAIWHLERALHLPSEVTLQQAVLPHVGLVEFFDTYYSVAHVNGLLLALLWIFLRHRDRYAEARNTIALTTFACLLIALLPVAPPRLLDAHGLVDAAALHGQSVYGPVGTGVSDQYSAMPSVHVAWAMAVAVLCLRLTRSRWRWMAVAHAGLTWLVVVTTANHYWADGLVATGLLGLAMVAAGWWARRRAEGGVSAPPRPTRSAPTAVSDRTGPTTARPATAATPASR